MIRLPPASRALIAFPDAILGLTPQALCWRPLRGLFRITTLLQCKRHLMRQVYYCPINGLCLAIAYRPSRKRPGLEKTERATHDSDTTRANPREESTAQTPVSPAALTRNSSAARLPSGSAQNNPSGGASCSCWPCRSRGVGSAALADRNPCSL